jgi:hypothetical protein
LENFMTKPITPKPAKPAAQKPAAKSAAPFAGLTKPSDAGRHSAAMGGKGSSNGKGR